MTDSLRLLSYNIQVGIHTRRPRDYLLHGWKHLVPHAARTRNLDRIAEVLAGHDIVALQETDAGSARSRFVNLTEYLADKAGMPFWHHQVNRRLGRFAQHAHGLISRIEPFAVESFALPGLIPGRNLIVARYGNGTQLSVFHAHLALTTRARRKQLAFIAELLQDHPHAVLMGDLNCRADSPEMLGLFERTGLREPAAVLNTFPSWRPRTDIDHVLVTPTLAVTAARVLPHAYSDHLPLSVEIALPRGLRLDQPSTASRR